MYQLRTNILKGIVTSFAIFLLIPSFVHATNQARVTYQPGFYYESINSDIKKRIDGKSYKTDGLIPYSDLRYITVQYYDFDGNIQTGELICNKKIADDLVEIFYCLYLAKYPIDKLKLIDDYDADDELSCADDNSSCFNYRVIAGTKKLSKHARGMAIDINPYYNPCITYTKGIPHVFPAGSEDYADRNSDFPHKIDENDLCYILFKQHGFHWGGDWKSLKDYQHFEK